MRPRGRPRLDDDDRRAVNITFRVSAKQFDQTQKEAERARLPLAGWLRRIVEEACRGKPKV
jgi:hypothetical protein